MNRGFNISGFGDPSYSTSAVASPSAISVGQSTVITAMVANNVGTANDKIVDVEIHDASNNQVFQAFFDGQYFTVGASPTEYPINWMPTTSGTYKVSVGVFNYDWSEVESWNDNAVSVTAGNGSPSYIVDIWWPTDGSVVNGVQPFKALLEDTPLSGYIMYWQVDGGTLNLMSDSSSGGDHKQVDVDLSGWTWKGTGPYVVNFVAKDLNGNMLAQRSVGITVVQ